MRILRGNCCHSVFQPGDNGVMWRPGIIGWTSARPARVPLRTLAQRPGDSPSAIGLTSLNKAWRRRGSAGTRSNGFPMARAAVRSAEVISWRRCLGRSAV